MNHPPNEKRIIGRHHRQFNKSVKHVAKMVIKKAAELIKNSFENDIN